MEQAARSHQWKVFCAITSNASPSGKCVKNWGCCRITDPSFLQRGFLLQPVAGTSLFTAWRVLLFPLINLPAPLLSQNCRTELSGGNTPQSFRSEVYLQLWERPMLHACRRDVRLSLIMACTSPTDVSTTPQLVITLQRCVKTWEMASMST